MHLRRAMAAVALVMILGGCAPSLITPAPSPATPSPSPTPAPVANCWIATRGEYRLEPLQGGAASAADVEDAARIVHQRLAALGLVTFEVTVGEGGTVVIVLPTLAQDALIEARQVITPVGLVTFVPLPDDMSAEPGGQLPTGLTPLFGREAIREVRATEDETGRPAVDVSLNEQGTQQLADFSRANVGSRLAIVFGDTILSAPTIVAPLEAGQMQISGNVDANQLVALISLPPLAGPLEEVSFEDVERPAGCPV